MDKPIMIFGAGPMTLAAIELFEDNKNVVYGILDDDKSKEGTEFGDISVLGSTSDENYLKFIGDTCEAFLALDEIAWRKDLSKTLIKNYKTMPVNGIHSSAIIPESAELGHGNFIDSGVSLGSESKIGSHCIFHMSSSVGHGSKIGDFSQIGQGSAIAQSVVIGSEVFVGAGCVVVGGIKIGDGARIGAGSVVIENVPKGATVFGNPAKKVQV